MNLNCKPGDLAVVVSGYPESNIGKVITVTRIATLTSAVLGFPCWEYEGHLDSTIGGRSGLVHDACLRPIRPGDGADETLDWAGLPATHDAPVTA